jgi:hypothetical protein
MAVLRFLLAWAGLAALLAVVRPVDPDPTPWLQAAESLRSGRLAPLPPLWPTLTVSASFLANVPLVTAGAYLTIVLASGVPVISTAIARRLNVDWGAALMVGATAGAAMAPFLYDLAPNALLAFTLLLVVWSGLEWEAAPDDSFPMLIWLTCAGLAACTHEVGLITLWAVAIAIVARAFPRTAGEITAATAMLGLFAIVGGSATNLPDRLAGPLVTSPWNAGAGAPPDWAHGAAALAWQHGNRWGVMPAFLERFLTPPHAVGWVALAGAVSATLAWNYARHKRYGGDPSRPHPWALLSGLSPALAALIVWTHPTDLLVVVPVAAIGLGALVAALGDWKERLATPAHVLIVAALFATAAPVWWTAHHDAPIVASAPTGR